ncbi:MAG: ComF family protein [Ruminococcus sp.]|nr:ComF family protein [Ruminococcus sp.]
MSKLADWLLDVFFPNRCPCCGKVIRWDLLVCGKCAGELRRFDNSSDTPPEGCSASFSLYRYEGPAKPGIYSIKDGTGKNFIRFSADRIAPELEDCGADLITFVPRAKRKKREYGFDQAEMIAKALSGRMGIPCDSGLIARRRDRTEQRELNAGERSIHAKSVYVPAKGARDIKGRCILLADDVRTTGATLEACTHILREAGASEVITVTLCRAVLDSD